MIGVPGGTAAAKGGGTTSGSGRGSGGSDVGVGSKGVGWSGRVTRDLRRQASCASSVDRVSLLPLIFRDICTFFTFSFTCSSSYVLCGLAMCPCSFSFSCFLTALDSFLCMNVAVAPLSFAPTQSCFRTNSGKADIARK